MKSIKMHCICIAGALLAGSATAGVIYDNGSILGGGARSDVGFTTQFQGADDFVLQSGMNTIRDVHWAGKYVGNVVEDNFTIRIFEDNSGLPQDNFLFEFAVGSVSREATGILDPNGTEISPTT
jgi:hypothetical protein